MSRFHKLVWALWLASLALVAMGSLAPGSSALMRAVGSAQVNDKVLHFSAYVVLAFLPALVETSGIRLAATVAAVVALGVALEFVQRLVPGRAFDTRDMLANCLGVCCGAGAAALRKWFSGQAYED